MKIIDALGSVHEKSDFWIAVAPESTRLYIYEL
jgi:hypothetical protein